MLKAGALLYAVTVALLLAFISSAFILYAYLNRSHTDNYFLINKIENNSLAGITFLESSQNEVRAESAVWIDLFNNGEDSVFLQKKYWGIFEVLSSRAVSHNFSTEKKVMTAFHTKPENDFSFYLADNKRQLSISGSTSVHGICFLPAEGTRKNNIEDRGEYGDGVLKAQIKKSNEKIPGLDNELLERIKRRIENSSGQNDSMITFSDEKSMTNSFQNKTIVLFSSSEIKLAETNLSGNIIISSSKKITVAASAKINDLILVAPVIIIKEGFKGSLQAFAKDSITADSCTLTYPSVLGMITEKEGIIKLSRSAKITGSIFLHCKEEKNAALISIEKGSVINGEIYSDAATDMKGTLYGSLCTQKIVVITPATVYGNYLHNAVIDLSKRSAAFLGLRKEGIIQRSGIVKWCD